MKFLFSYALTTMHHHNHAPLLTYFTLLILSRNIHSSQQTTTNRTQTATEYRTSYQVTKQARNTVVDTRGGRKVEGGVFSEYYPGRSRAKIVNVDEEKQGGYAGREEPQVKVRNIRHTGFNYFFKLLLLFVKDSLVKIGDIRLIKITYTHKIPSYLVAVAHSFKTAVCKHVWLEV